MKKLSVILTLILATNYLIAQTTVQRPQSVSSDQYDQLKKEGKLSNGLYVLRANQNAVPLKTVISIPSTPQTVPANCNCLLQTDASFQVVPFASGLAPDYRNDDGSTPVINLPFNFCFYGQIQNQIFINNNGNITFGAPYGAFSAASFPSNSYVMIAPFWADADTRGVASGIVYYKVTPTAMIVRWKGIGYYSQHVDKLNDFQLIITDGTDPLLPVGSNVGFCYGDMQWTSGDANGGMNGFGGAPATVGCNVGDGVNYIQIGTFNAGGTTYNGPFSLSQVDWLDNKQFFLDVCSTGGGGNIPPIMHADMVCDTTITICVGDTLPIIADFISPENNQNTTISAAASGTGYTTLSSVPGNPGTYSGIFVGLASNVGTNTILLSGTDNGVPSQTTTGIITVHVISGPTASFTSTGICPGAAMPFMDASTSVNGSLVSYHWDFGMPALTTDTSNLVSPQYVYNTPGTYQVTLLVVDSLGCKDTMQQNVNVFYLPQINFSGGPLNGCAPMCVTLTDASTVQNSTVTHWNWQFGDGGTDTLQTSTHCYPVNGNYSVILTATSAQGCTYTDSISNYVHVIPGPQAAFSFGPQPATNFDPTINFTDLSTGNPAMWFWDFGTGNDTSIIQNPSFNFPDTGSFTVMLIVSTSTGACADTAYETVVISPELLVWIPNAFTPNGNGVNDIFTPVFSDPSYVRSYDMMIFDRWGNMLFETQDPYKGWDGKTKSEKAVIDTYVFRVTVEGSDGIPHKYIGHVNLIR